MITAFAAAAVAIVCAAPTPCDDVEQMSRRWQTLFKRTSFLNLVNGLHLSRGQMVKLVTVNEKMREEVMNVAKEYKIKIARAVDEVEDWIAVIKDAKLPQDALRRAAAADGVMVRFHSALHGLVARYAESVEAVFTDAQKDVIENFSPCVTPPKNLKNPVRAGQARENEKIVRAFRYLRSLPPRHQRRGIERGVRQMLEFEREHGVSEEELRQEEERIRTLLEKICKMKEVDFELEKDKLADELIDGSSYERVKKLHKERVRIDRELSETMRKRHAASGDPYVRFFLDPGVVIPILKYRIALLDAENAEDRAKAEEKCAGVLLEEAKDYVSRERLRDARMILEELLSKYPRTECAEQGRELKRKIDELLPDGETCASPKRK